MLQSYIGCICFSFLHRVFACAFSNPLLHMMHDHIDCTFLTSSFGRPVWLVYDFLFGHYFYPNHSFPNFDPSLHRKGRDMCVHLISALLMPARYCVFPVKFKQNVVCRSHEKVKVKYISVCKICIIANQHYESSCRSKKLIADLSAPTSPSKLWIVFTIDSHIMHLTSLKHSSEIFHNQNNQSNSHVTM